MHFVIKKDSPKWKLCIGDVKTKQAHKFNSLGGVVTDDVKCDTEIRSHLEIAKYIFQKIIEVLRKENIVRNKEKTVELLYNI